ncbi:MAG: 30S ribosomal protein S7 [Proteobacteria bacterium]|nr:MAG: 30S ribosomal protein S7 [Pseudomonadota bacterium]
MGRKKVITKREIIPDPKFHDIVVTKFVNALMKGGKKSVAEGILYGSLDIIQEKLSEDAIKVFKKAIDNVKPHVEVKSRRVGGANFQVPVEVRPARRQSLSSRWIIEYARKRTEKSMRERLAGELIDAFQMRGGAIKKREDIHRMAEANKAFAHFRF